MTRRFSSSFLALLLLGSLIATPAFAESDVKPDDTVMFRLSVEDWVTTQTARVLVNVEAAVSGNSAGTMRDDMMKAVNNMVKTDWRLTSFNRMEDQTGLERWSAVFESRVPEASLNGLNDQAKKASKAGMQLTVQHIEFTPTLAERQAADSRLRAHIYKLANEQLAELNKAMPDRKYRIGMINFLPNTPMNYGGRQKTMRAAAPMMAEAAMDSVGGGAPMEQSEKAVVNATVVLAAEAPQTPTKQ